MRVAGSGSMSGSRILQLLQSGYQEFLRWLSARSNSSLSSNLNFEEKFLSQQCQVPAGWPNFLCVCSVFSSVSVQLHWSQWPPNQSAAASKWSCTSKGLLGAGPSGIMAADAIVTDAGAMHVAGVPIVNPLTVVVWEVTPVTGNGFQATPKASISNGVPPSLNPPYWDGLICLAGKNIFYWKKSRGESTLMKIKAIWYHFTVPQSQNFPLT